MSFKIRLKEEISYQDLLLKELADKANISKRTIESYVDSRGRMPAADVAVRIATILNISVEYLVTGKNKNKHDDMEKYRSIRKVMDDFLLVSDDVRNSVEVMLHSAAQAELEKNQKTTKNS